MRGLPTVEPASNTRVRRWDAVVVGAALPGLVAAARLGMAGHRVLVLEERAATEQPACLREPFFLGHMERDAVLGACLRALRIPLIDQRRVVPDPLALQVVLPEARLDVGEPALCVDEWVAWGLAKPEPSRALAAGLLEAGLAESEALLADPIVSVRGTRRSPEKITEIAERTKPSRGLPGALADAPERVRTVLGAWLRALSHLGGPEPSDAARAHLLGAPLRGSAATREAGALEAVLRRRIETLYGEFRTLPDAFRLVAAGGQPGVAPDADGSSGEIWVARALVLNAPRAALASAVTQDPVPDLLQSEAPRWKRLQLHWRLPQQEIPEAMAPRVVLVRDESEPLGGTNVIALRGFSAGGGLADLVATATLHADADDARCEAEIERAVRELLPFAGEQLVRVEGAAPRWDLDAPPADPAHGGWPETTELRIANKQPVYSLDRSAVAALGTDGDWLLGWRGGDAIAAELK